MTELVHLEDKGRVRTIALNRPDKMNALSHALASIRRAFATEDAQEARRAFFEKRPPVSRGR